METAFTSTRRALDVAEWVTTGLALVLSTTLYLRHGHPYLARGVVGDLLGFALLAGVLGLRQRRARHEALVCLAGIGAVWSIRPAWPLSFSSNLWRGAVVLGLAIYLGIRQRMLAQA